MDVKLSKEAMTQWHNYPWRGKQEPVKTGDTELGRRTRCIPSYGSSNLYRPVDLDYQAF